MSVQLAYREEQLQMLREELRSAYATIDSLKLTLALMTDRAEAAEARVRIMREEIRDAKRTPFDE